MAIIAQRPLFGWQEIEPIGDLARLHLVLSNLPDQELVATLEGERGLRGRDDYPVRAMWNATVAGVVFQHPTVAALLRELARNGQLRQLCGFWSDGAAALVPPPWVFSRFLSSLMRHVDLLEAMFERLVEEIAEILPDYGEHLALDGKALSSYARGKAGNEEPDGRRDTDGEWGVHAHRGVREDGTLWEKTKRWFGYSLHLIVDSTYELPVGFSVSKANSSEVVEAHHLLDRVQEGHPDLAGRCESVAADRGYDDVKLIGKIWESWKGLPVIDIRNCWHDGETTKVATGCENVVYDYRGTVSCVCPRSGKQRLMAYGGLERDRGTLKYRCAAQHYGLECAGAERCPIGKAVRISMEQEPRVFTPLPRHTPKWRRLYARRTAVERVNSRLDNVFGFENHTIRGLLKMRTRCALALVVMLAMALGRIRANQGEAMRSLLARAG